MFDFRQLVSDGDFMPHGMCYLWRPDILSLHVGSDVLDLSLPDASGVTLVRRLRAEPAIQPIPILAVTAYAERFARNIHLDAGCDAYLAKPCDTRTLVRHVEELRKRADG